MPTKIAPHIRLLCFLWLNSSAAFAQNTFYVTPKQIDMIDDYARLLIVDLSTIEANGGGSARCMMAEVHLPRK